LIIQSYTLNKKIYEKSNFLLIYHQLIGQVNLSNEIDFTNDVVKLSSPKKWFEQKFDQVFENQRGFILGRLAREVYFQIPETHLIEFLMNYQLSLISGFKHWSRRHSYSVSYELLIERNNLKIKVKYGYYMGDNARSGDGEIIIKLEEYYKSQTMNDSKE